MVRANTTTRRPTAGAEKFYANGIDGSGSRVDLNAINGKTGAPLSGNSQVPTLPLYSKESSSDQSSRPSRSARNTNAAVQISYISLLRKKNRSVAASPYSTSRPPWISLRTRHVVVLGVVALLVVLGAHAFVFQPEDDPNHAHVLTDEKEKERKLINKTSGDPSPATDPGTAGHISHISKATHGEDRWHPPPHWKLTPLRQIDVEKYTVRINAWRRPEQLVVSVHHLLSCPNVAQVQIIWCDKSTEPPQDIMEQEDVVVERHDLNSLNERFRILSPTPTLGVLSIDDDVLRPCEAMDSGFFRWTQAPERMVGFDGRLHVEHSNGSWQYGYLSTMKEANKYSISLTRFCFIHRDYMDLYVNHLPSSMLDQIAKTFNCEDIAMSFLTSALTDGKAPLLADYWAVVSMIKLHTAGKISAGKEHKALRDKCTDSFAQVFGLKDENSSNRLKPSKFVHSGHHSWLECGDRLSSHNSGLVGPRLRKSDQQKGYETMVSSWKHLDQRQRRTAISHLFATAGAEAYEKGFIEGSKPWKKRFSQKQ